MKIIELFSGIGGFTKGFLDAGYEFSEHYFSEVEKHAIANYKYNFPNAKYIGSVTDIPNGSFKGIDIITFGSPCQDFSLSGKRKGLKGERSNLIKEAIRLVADIRPSIFIWENVKGTFSSNNSEDFWAILQAFANIGGYRLEWQLLNTRWFLPQNRERIYLVGHLARRSEPRVFPIGEEITMDNQRSTEKQVASCLQGSGGHIANGEYRGMNLIQIGTLRTHNDGKGFREVKSKVCPAILSRARQDGSGQSIIQINLSKESGGKQPYQQNRIYDEKGISPALNRGKSDLIIKNKSDIRRLTEIECERLQSFPDDWTRYGNYDGEVKEISKTQRYKMLGNAVTVKVVEEIAKRLKENTR